ncbi:MAG: hypothetical protein U5S82_10660 [Gammaproteobacteria bacterium]|nr:hypothetical protein [Gammaproteobacteria bacterium]
MPPGRVKRLLGGFTPIAALSLLLLISLKLMSDATANSTRFDELYSLLLLINAAGLLILAVLIVLNVSRLVHQLRTRAPGARLAGRMVLVFSTLAVTPVLVVFYFSVQFLNEGIDNWFDVEIEDALNDALKLSRTAIDNRMAELLRNTEQLAAELAGVTEGSLAMHLDDMRERANASEYTLFSPSRGIIASSSAFSTNIIPHARRGHSAAGPAERPLHRPRPGARRQPRDARGGEAAVRHAGARHPDVAGPASGGRTHEQTRPQRADRLRPVQATHVPARAPETQLHPDPRPGTPPQPANGGLGGLLLRRPPDPPHTRPRGGHPGGGRRRL